MKMRWTQWIDELDPRFLDELDLEEEEVEALTQKIDLANVRQRALRGLGSGKRPASKKMRRIVAVALAAAVACVGTVWALKRGALEQFFGIDATLGEEQVTRVGQSQVKDGIRLTLEDVIPGRQSAVAVLSLAREDGEPFPLGTTLENLDLHIEGKDTLIGYTRFSRISEDQRTLQVVAKLDNSETPLQGETLNVKASLLYSSEDRDADSHLDLDAIYQRLPVAISTAEQGGQEDDDFKVAQAFQQAVAGQLTAAERKLEISGPGFAGIGFVDGQLWLGIQYQGSTPLSNSADIYSLRDSRTGAEYNFQHNYTTGDEGNGPQLSAYLFEGLTPADLPYLTMVVSYNIPSVLSQGQWELAYTFTGEPLTEQWEMEQNLRAPGGEVALTRMECSAIGLKIYGQWLGTGERSGAPKIQPGVALVLEEGAKVPMQFQCSSINSQDGKSFYLEYSLPEGPGQKGYLDRDTLASIRTIEIDGKFADLVEK